MHVLLNKRSVYMQKANNTKIKNVTTNDAGDVTLHINVADSNYTVNNALVESITLNVCADGEEMYAGDLAVNWKAVDDSNYKHNTSLLMRDVADNNTNTQTMSAFYWDGEFTSTLHNILLANGFSSEAVADVYTSEWGMQDVARASYDAFALAHECLKAHNIKIAEDA